MKLDCFIVWLHAKLLKGHAWFTQAKDEKTLLKKHARFLHQWKKKENKTTRSSWPKKPKNKIGEFKTPNFLETTKKSMTWGGKKREWKAWNKLAFERNNNKKKWGAWISPPLPSSNNKKKKKSNKELQAPCPPSRNNITTTEEKKSSRV